MRRKISPCGRNDKDIFGTASGKIDDCRSAIVEVCLWKLTGAHLSKKSGFYL
jgi:hypothetical protein